MLTTLLPPNRIGTPSYEDPGSAPVSCHTISYNKILNFTVQCGSGERSDVQATAVLWESREVWAGEMVKRR